MEIYNNINRKKFTKTLVVLIFFIFIVNFLANKFYWYSSIWYFDMIMHTLGGIWLGLFFLYFTSTENKYSKGSILKILLYVLSIGIAWEIYELLINNAVAQNSFNILDTLSDIFFDLTGGTLAILYFFKKIMLVDQNTL